MSQADDKILEDLLRRRQEDPGPSGGPLCGDPELLAAFAEDALAGKPREEMDRHLAACAACREAVARLVRLAPRPGVVAPASQVAGWKRWVWAAPALAGVVLVGSFVMFNRQQIVEQPQLQAKQQPVVASPVVDAIEPKTEPAQPKPSRRENKAAAKEVKEEARAAKAPAAQPPPVSVAAEKERDTKLEAKADVDVAKAQTPQQQAYRSKDAVAESAGTRQAQVRDQAQSQAAPAPPQQTQQTQQQIQVFARAPKEGATVGGTATGAGQAKVAGPMLRSTPSSLAKPSAETVEVQAAASNVLGDDRADKSKKLGMFLSTDSKIAKRVQVKGTLRVWTLLADGRLLLSFDGGTTWKEVAVPERPKSLTARDASQAEITTVSGRVYRTTDAGASWILVPPR